MTARSVVVIGGGLAGITAAIALREADIGVTRLPTSVISYTSTGIGNASAASSRLPL